MDAKISVCPSFDFDAMSLWIGGFRARSLSAISRGEFGRVGYRSRGAAASPGEFSILVKFLRKRR
ncbi:MAG TPA: hypothetical protein VNF29_12025 [Candidatus Binataceae bacterium]|nr:hypothetical protein [Candidatus Binataceae bacterium]